MQKEEKKLSLSARAAWMYYIAGMTQQDIAQTLGISRQVAQRLVSQANESGMVQVTIDHPVANCLQLGKALEEKYQLSICRVAPSAGNNASAVNQMIASAGADVMSQFFAHKEQLTIGIGSGRTLRSTIEALPRFDKPKFDCVSLVGAIASDGSCSRYDLPAYLAEKTDGKYFILPAPLYADNEADQRVWSQHRIYRIVADKAINADITFLGIGQVDIDCPLVKEGFITKDDVKALIKLGVTGEMLGHFINEQGEKVNTHLDKCLTSIQLSPHTHKQIIAFSGGSNKHKAIHAVLKGKWVSGLVTDEDTAMYLLKKAN